MALIKIYTARDSLEAHFLRSLLEQAGVKAAVMGEMLSIARGDLPATQETLPSVWIHEYDTERARPVFEDYLRQQQSDAETPAGEPWSCPACGETIEGQFDACWHCGQTRDGQPPVNFQPATTYVPECQTCGYNLTGLTSPCCPECGEAIEQSP